MVKTYHKPTRAEEEARVAYAAHLLSRCAYKGEIKRLLKARYGVSARTCERYLARARELLAERLGADLDRHRAEALALYESVIRAEKATTRDRLFAQERIDKLLGLELRGRAAEDAERHGREARELSELRRQAVRDDEARELMARLAERLGGPEAGEEGAPASDTGVAGLPGVLSARKAS